MPISKNDKVLVLNKLCENLLKLEPQELPTLAFQLFTLSTTPAQLMIPLISLNQYFQKYLYQKQLDQTSNSEQLNFDSIGELSLWQIDFQFSKWVSVPHSIIIYGLFCYFHLHHRPLRWQWFGSGSKYGFISPEQLFRVQDQWKGNGSTDACKFTLDWNIGQVFLLNSGYWFSILKLNNEPQIIFVFF